MGLPRNSTAVLTCGQSRTVQAKIVKIKLKMTGTQSIVHIIYCLCLGDFLPST